jgi:peptide/nickel transport system ATP-binding protein
MTQQNQQDTRTLLDIQDMRIWYTTVAGEAKVVDGVDLVVKRDELLGLAGESGCGKSTLVEGILRLIKLPGYIKTGRVMFYPRRPTGDGDAIDLVQLRQNQLRPLRWRHIAYIPQGAMNALNPVMRIQDQILDAMTEHGDISRFQAQQRMCEVLELVGLPVDVARMYPHELSGGMKQRVTIASSVTLEPDLLVADEPTTALDVNVQRIILQELRDIRERLGLTIIYVSHDMAVHAELADRMAIMYAGVVVEVGSTVDIFKDPQHPYTQGLIQSIPGIGGERKRMEGIPGLSPSPLAWPQGCRFHPRCRHAMEICQQKDPALVEVAPGRQVACFLFHTSEKNHV